jgi:hypothetical protein
VHLDKVKADAPARVRRLQGYIEEAYADLLRSQPMATTTDFAPIIRRMLDRPDVQRTLDVGN